MSIICDCKKKCCIVSKHRNVNGIDTRSLKLCANKDCVNIMIKIR